MTTGRPRKEIEEAIEVPTSTLKRALSDLTRIGDLAMFDDGPRGAHRYRFERGTALEPFQRGPLNT